MPRWKKVTGGNHYCRIGGKSTILKKDGKAFEAEEWELGVGFLDRYERLDSPKDEDEDEGPVNVLVAKHKGHGRWVVINQDTGEAINDNYLTKLEAEDIVQEKLDEDEDEEAGD